MVKGSSGATLRARPLEGGLQLGLVGHVEDVGASRRQPGIGILRRPR